MIEINAEGDFAFSLQWGGALVTMETRKTS